MAEPSEVTMIPIVIWGRRRAQDAGGTQPRRHPTIASLLGVGPLACDGDR
jgi:hypothetical protein